MAQESWGSNIMISNQSEHSLDSPGPMRVLTCLFLTCSVSTSARTDLLARVTLALRLTLPARALPASGSFSVLESSKLARLALLLQTQKISQIFVKTFSSLPTQTGPVWSTRCGDHFRGVKALKGPIRGGSTHGKDL